MASKTSDDDTKGCTNFTKLDGNRVPQIYDATVRNSVKIICSGDDKSLPVFVATILMMPVKIEAFHVKFHCASEKGLGAGPLTAVFFGVMEAAGVRPCKLRMAVTPKSVVDIE